MFRRTFIRLAVASVCALGLLGVAQARDLNEIIESKTIRIDLCKMLSKSKFD